MEAISRLEQAAADRRYVRRAIEIRDGLIQNERILSFQHRAPDYPYPRASPR